MQLPKMQPTLRLSLPGSSGDVLAKIRQAINSPELAGHAVSAGPCIDFAIEEEDRRFWSPHLSVQLSDSESGTELFGRFSPRPEIWTMFMAIYFLAATVMFGATIYGYVQWSLGAAPWALVIVPVGLAIITGLHLASLIGQGFSSDQMELLRNRLDRAVEIAFAEGPHDGHPI